MAIMQFESTSESQDANGIETGCITDRKGCKFPELERASDTVSTQATESPSEESPRSSTSVSLLGDDILGPAAAPVVPFAEVRYAARATDFEGLTHAHDKVSLAAPPAREQEAVNSTQQVIMRVPFAQKQHAGRIGFSEDATSVSSMPTIEDAAAAKSQVQDEVADLRPMTFAQKRFAMRSGMHDDTFVSCPQIEGQVDNGCVSVVTSVEGPRVVRSVPYPVDNTDMIQAAPRSGGFAQVRCDVREYELNNSVCSVATTEEHPKSPEETRMSFVERRAEARGLQNQVLKAPEADAAAATAYSSAPVPRAMEAPAPASFAQKRFAARFASDLDMFAF